MSQIPEVNPAAAPVPVVDNVGVGGAPVRSQVPWKPVGLIMGITFALLQLMHEVGSLMAVNLYGQMIVELQLNASSVTWTFLSTAIASAATLGLVARLGDAYGHRKMLFATLAITTVGFALSALAPNFVVLIIGRVLVGITAAPALCLAILNNRLSVSNQKRAVGIITAGLALAVFVGFGLGGIMVEIGASWRAAFWSAAALTLLSVIGLFWVPESDAATRKKSSFDLPGVIMLGVGLTGLCVGFSQGGTWGWTSPLTLTCLIGGVVVGAAWVTWEARHPDPLVDPRLIVSRRLLPAYGTFVVIGFTAVTLYQIVASYGQADPAAAGYGFGLSPLYAGFLLLGVTIGGLITSRTTPYLLARYRARTVLLVGAIGYSAAFFWLAMFHTEPWNYHVGIMLFGMSVTTTITTAMSVLTAEAPPERAAGVSSVYLVGSTVAASLGTAVYASVMSTGAVEGSPYVTPATFDLAFWIVAIASLSGVVFALILSRDSRANAGSIR